MVSGANVDIKFSGAAAEVKAEAGTPLADPVDLDDANTTLRITVDGVEQTIQLPTDSTPRADFITAINSQMRGGYARLTKGNEGGANRLVIGSDRRGKQAQVSVLANPELGFPTDRTVSGSDNVNNNVGDLFASDAAQRSMRCCRPATRPARRLMQTAIW